MFSILHISDLHRSRKEPIANADLIASLVADRDRYLGENPSIPTPEAIVVSGDLIYGASINAPAWRDSIHDQYAVAEEFLVELCGRFLQGDRRRLILTPGNHDVCWNTAYRAMKTVAPQDYPRRLDTVLSEPDSVYRWRWSDRTLFKIEDPTQYRQRLDAYWSFASNFYAGTELPLPLDRNRGFQLFELFDRRVLVASFDSTSNNDCFRSTGALQPGAVGSCATTLRESTHAYELKVGLWHHSIQGPPLRSDYMDASCVQQMAAHGFQLGLHGHQHVAGTVTQFVHLDEPRTMAVVSAGSLCAGSGELPRGVNRQYNVVVIDDGFQGARIHVREMGDGQQFTRRRTGEFRVDGSIRVDWQRPMDSAGRYSSAARQNEDRSIECAEYALKSGNPMDAITALRGIDTTTESYGRNLLVQALFDAEDAEAVRALLRKPLNAREAAMLISALVELHDYDAAQDTLDGTAFLDRGTRVTLQERIDTRRMMNRP